MRLAHEEKKISIITVMIDFSYAQFQWQRSGLLFAEVTRHEQHSALVFALASTAHVWKSAISGTALPDQMEYQSLLKVQQHANDPESLTHYSPQGNLHIMHCTSEIHVQTKVRTSTEAQRLGKDLQLL
jgi:hypothetical protein